MFAFKPKRDHSATRLVTQSMNETCHIVYNYIRYVITAHSGVKGKDQVLVALVPQGVRQREQASFLTSLFLQQYLTITEEEICH